MVRSREVTVQHLSHKRPPAIAIEQKSIRAAVLSLITRIRYQCEPDAIIPKQPERVIPINKRLALIACQRSRLVCEITNIQVDRVGGPPCRIRERRKIGNQRLDRRYSRRSPQSLFV